MERPTSAPGSSVDDRFFVDAPVLAAYGTLEGRFTRVGGPWAEVLGWSHEDLTTRPFIEFVHPEDLETTAAQLELLTPGGPPVPHRNRWRTADGRWVWLQWHTRITDHGTVCGVAVDVTGVVAHERELERRRQLFEVVASYQQRALGEETADAGLADALAAAAAVIGATSATVLALETTEVGTRELEGLATYGPEPMCQPGDRITVIEGVEPRPGRTPTLLEATSVVARFGRPVLTAWTDGRVADTHHEVLALPLAHDRSVGIVTFTRSAEPFTGADIDVLAPLTGAFAGAIERDRSRAVGSRMSAEVGRLSSMLGAMLERSEFIVIVTDALGRVELLNATATRMLGGRASVEEHAPVDRLLAPGVAHGSLAASLVAFENAASESEWTFADATGRSIDLLVSASPIFAEAGTLEGWMLVCRPAEDRVRAERERLERARLAAQVDLLERRERQLAALAEATQYVMASHTHREALDVIDHFLPAAFGPGRAALFRVAGVERTAQPSDPAVFQPGDCWAVRTGHTFRNEPDAAVRCPHLDHGVAAVCAPIGDGQVWSGVVVLRADDHEDAAAIAANESLLDDVARQLSNAMANLRLRRALEEQATRDPLTGVGNRRAAEAALANAITRARAHGEPFAVVMVDLDQFKAVNDRYGHEVGDEVLVRFAGFLRERTREDDSVTRIGGEEFLLVLHDIPEDALERTLEALRAGVPDITVRPDLRLTASFGGVHVSGVDAEPAVLVAAADELMYAAKHAGRDRVEVAPYERFHPKDRRRS
jgi:diguanylate cyclase (GGDEF)-like protein/PAS domain S-box-containing protein